MYRVNIAEKGHIPTSAFYGGQESTKQSSAKLQTLVCLITPPCHAANGVLVSWELPQSTQQHVHAVPGAKLVIELVVSARPLEFYVQ